MPTSPSSRRARARACGASVKRGPDPAAGGRESLNLDATVLAAPRSRTTLPRSARRSSSRATCAATRRCSASTADEIAGAVRALEAAARRALAGAEVAARNGCPCAASRAGPGSSAARRRFCSRRRWSRTSPSTAAGCRGSIRSPGTTCRRSRSCDADACRGRAARSPAAGIATPATGRRAAARRPPARPAARRRRRCAAGQVSLRAAFAADSWVEIFDGSGKAVLYDLGKAGTERTLTATAPLSVTIGNAAGRRA